MVVAVGMGAAAVAGAAAEVVEVEVKSPLVNHLLIVVQALIYGCVTGGYQSSSNNAPLGRSRF